MAAIDPINYASTLTMPKLILSTGGDEFLLPDNNDYYWPALQGEKVRHHGCTGCSGSSATGMHAHDSV